MNDRDRQRILERRALFLGSSLAVLSCGPRPAATGPEVVRVEQPGPADGPAASASASQRPAAGKTPRPAPASADLDIRVPDGVSERAREIYESLIAHVQAQTELLEKVSPMIPQPCDLHEATCADAFMQVALLMQEYRKNLSFSYYCKGSSDDAKAFAAVEERVRKALADRHEAVLGEIKKSLGARVNNPEGEWEKIMFKAYGARPHPCLSIGCADW